MQGIPPTLRSLTLQIAVGVGAASFWRGAWYVLDDCLYPDEPLKSAASSFVAGCFGLGLTQGGVSKALTTKPKVLKQRILDPRKLAAMYGLAMSCVLIWRGTWMMWDLGYEYFYAHISDDDSKNGKVKHIFSIKNHYPNDPRVFDQLSKFDGNKVSTGTYEITEKKDDDNPTPIIHGTLSGMISHVPSTIILISIGLFASVFAPPASFCVVKDASLKVGRHTGIALVKKYLPKRHK